MNDETRSALLVTHTGRSGNTDQAHSVAKILLSAGFRVRMLAEEAADVPLADVEHVAGSDASADKDEIVIALGGDGTFLRAAELARPAGAPLLGINLGHVGFLAEAECMDLEFAVRQIAAGDYTVEERFTVEVRAELEGRVIAESWALNEATVEKGMPSRMLEVLVEIDGRRLSRYGCDGIVCATPTGSTAYAMSAGGPVVWPEVQALLFVPISAHTLFSRPLVVSPSSTVEITVEPHTTLAVLSCDGRRVYDLPPGSKVRVVRGSKPVRVVHLSPQSFTERLVAKLRLPVDGWRQKDS
ncbi:NAD kinase 2 [Actinorhabdospora filicis]|uniref:NAD kinase n=1 Tax=Actinorhabdospora filicis TaxID=1785913 RepID=A0A9W6SP53_9ACTN|nr:NAD kinase [Actinorhabdospora filicis]GLZ79322.1 NAD kinase 2 [Actinorhabdospora filicis]